MGVLIVLFKWIKSLQSIGWYVASMLFMDRVLSSGDTRTYADHSNLYGSVEAYVGHMWASVSYSLVSSPHVSQNPADPHRVIIMIYICLTCEYLTVTLHQSILLTTIFVVTVSCPPRLFGDDGISSNEPYDVLAPFFPIMHVWTLLLIYLDASVCSPVCFQRISAFIQTWPNTIKWSHCRHKRNSYWTSGCTYDLLMTRRIAFAIATCRALDCIWFNFDRICCTFGLRLRRTECIPVSNLSIELTIVYFRGPTSRYMADWSQFWLVKPCNDGYKIFWGIFREESSDS